MIAAMKEVSRIWILILGIAIAVVIAMAVLFNTTSPAFSVRPDKKRPDPAAASSVIIKKIIEKVDFNAFRLH